MEHINDLLLFVSYFFNYERNVDRINAMAEHLVSVFSEQMVIQLDELFSRLQLAPLRALLNETVDVSFDSDAETMFLIMQMLQTRQVPSLVWTKFKPANRFMIAYTIYYLTNIKACYQPDDSSNSDNDLDYDNYYYWLIANIPQDQIDLQSPIQCTVLLHLAQNVDNPELKQDLSEILYQLLYHGDIYYRTCCLQLIVKLKIKNFRSHDIIIPKVCLNLLEQYKEIGIFAGDVFSLLAIYNFEDIIELNKKDAHDSLLFELHTVYLYCFISGVKILFDNKNINNIQWYYITICSYFNVVLLTEKDIFTYFYQQWEEMIEYSVELANLVYHDEHTSNDNKMWIYTFINSYNTLRDKQIVGQGIKLRETASMSKGDRMGSLARIHEQTNAAIYDNLSSEQQLYHDQRKQIESLLAEIRVFLQDKQVTDDVARQELDDVSKLFITLDLLLPEFGFYTSQVVLADPNASFCECVCDIVQMFFKAFGTKFFEQQAFFCFVDILYKLRNSGLALEALINDSDAANENYLLWSILQRGIDYFIVQKRLDTYNQTCIKQIISILNRAMNEGCYGFVKHLLRGKMVHDGEDFNLIDQCLQVIGLFYQDKIGDVNSHALLQVTDLLYKLLLFYSFYAKYLLYQATQQQARVLIARNAAILRQLIEFHLFEKQSQNCGMQSKKDCYSISFQSSQLCSINLLLPTYLRHRDMLLPHQMIDLTLLQEKIRISLAAQREAISEMDYFYNTLSFYGIIIYEQYRQNWISHEMSSRQIEFCMQFFDDVQISITSYCNLLLKTQFPQNQIISHYLVFFACGVVYYNHQLKFEREILADERFYKFVQILLSSFCYCLSGYNIVLALREIIEVLSCDDPLLQKILAHLILQGFNGCVGRPQREQYFDYVTEQQCYYLNLTDYHNIPHFMKNLFCNKYSQKLQFDEDCVKMLYLHTLNQQYFYLGTIFLQNAKQQADNALTVYDYNYYICNEYLSSETAISVGLEAQLIRILLYNQCSYQTMYYTVTFLSLFATSKLDLSLYRVSREFSGDKYVDDGLPAKCYLNRITDNIVKMQDEYRQLRLIRDDVKESLIYNFYYVVEAMLNLYCKANSLQYAFRGNHLRVIMQFLYRSNVAELQILYLRPSDLDNFLRQRPLLFISFLVDLIHYSDYSYKLYGKLDDLMSQTYYGKLFNYAMLLSYYRSSQGKPNYKMSLDIGKIMQQFKDITTFDGILNDVRYQFSYRYILLHSLIKPKLVHQILGFEERQGVDSFTELKIEARIFGIFVYFYAIANFKYASFSTSIDKYLHIVMDFDQFLRDDGSDYSVQDFASDTLIVVDNLQNLLRYLFANESKDSMRVLKLVFDIFARLLQFTSYSPAFILLLQPLHDNQCFFYLLTRLGLECLVQITILLDKMLVKNQLSIYHASAQSTYLLGLKRQNSHPATSSLISEKTYRCIFVQPEIFAFCRHVCELIIALNYQSEGNAKTANAKKESLQVLCIYQLIYLFGSGSLFEKEDALVRFFEGLVTQIKYYDSSVLTKLAIQLLYNSSQAAYVCKTAYLQEVVERKCISDDVVAKKYRDYLVRILLMSSAADWQYEEFGASLIRYLYEYVLSDLNLLKDLKSDRSDAYKFKIIEKKIGLQKRSVLISY